jgi:hypothetical protein
MWQMIGVPAELERSLISERTRAGVKDAQRRGVKFGRKPKLTPQQINHARKLIDAGERREEVAALLNVTFPDSFSGSCHARTPGGSPDPTCGFWLQWRFALAASVYAGLE